MWNHKLCLSANLTCELSVEEQIRLFHKTGFEAFFTDYRSAKDVAAYAALAKELGMEYQSIHAPFNKSDDMWHGDDKTAKIAVDELIECLHACADNGVPIMIAHTYIGFYDGRKPTEQGLENYGKVVKEAEKLGIKIAFENTEGEEYLAALMEHFKNNPFVGFCWDSGHEMCYNGSEDMLALYGDRLIATHLNDNLGVKDFGGRITWHDDLHLLPFDGIADWDNIAERLDKCGYDGILTFELNINSKPDRHENDVYGKMKIEEYVAESYKRACRLATKRKVFTKNSKKQ